MPTNDNAVNDDMVDTDANAVGDVEIPTAAPPTKGEIRAKIFSDKSMAKKNIKVQFFGTEIEVRQPTVGELEKLTDRDTGQSSLVMTLIEHSYVPGTNEKVFNLADKDQLSSLPFDVDMIKIAEAIASLTNVQIKAAEKN